jgi:hypothetical protein
MAFSSRYLHRTANGARPEGSGSWALCGVLASVGSAKTLSGQAPDTAQQGLHTSFCGDTAVSKHFAQVQRPASPGVVQFRVLQPPSAETLLSPHGLPARVAFFLPVLQMRKLRPGDLISLLSTQTLMPTDLQVNTHIEVPMDTHVHGPHHTHACTHTLVHV